MAKKQWLYRIQPTRQGMLRDGPTPDEGALIERHFSYLKGLTDKGIVLLAGRTLNSDDSSFGIVIYVAEDEKSARAIFQEDPAVKAGVFRGEFFPFSIALWSRE